MTGYPEHPNIASNMHDNAELSDEHILFLSFILGGDCFKNPEGIKFHHQMIEAAGLAASIPRTPKQAVFVSDRPWSREPKLAYGLKKNGWDTILLYKEPPSFDVERYFSQSLQYQTPLDALLKAFSFSPAVFHLFSSWNFLTATAFIFYKPGKIIFDDYDVMAGMVNEPALNENLRIQYKLERFCLENADGLCCRSLETQYSKRHMGYKFRGKRLFFTDYCWNSAHRNDVKKPLKTEPLTIANVGNLYIDPHLPLDHKDNYHLKLAMEIAHFGIYSILCKAFLTEEIVQFVHQATVANPLISIKYLPYEAMLSEIQTRCHAGLICAPPNITSASNHLYLQTKRDFGIGNKAFDYMDAGLTVIIAAESKFLYWLIKRYHKVLDFDVFITNPAQYLELIHNWHQDQSLFTASRTLSVSVQAKRLISFYENV